MEGAGESQSGLGFLITSWRCRACPELHLSGLFWHQRTSPCFCCIKSNLILNDGSCLTKVLECLAILGYLSPTCFLCLLNTYLSLLRNVMKHRTYGYLYKFRYRDFVDSSKLMSKFSPLLNKYMWNIRHARYWATLLSGSSWRDMYLNSEMCTVRKCYDRKEFPNVTLGKASQETLGPGGQVGARQVWKKRSFLWLMCSPQRTTLVLSKKSMTQQLILSKLAADSC